MLYQSEKIVNLLGKDLLSKRQASLEIKNSEKEFEYQENKEGFNYIMGQKVRRLSFQNRIPLHLDVITQILQFKVQGKWFLITGSHDKTIKLWNIFLCPTNCVAEGD